MYVYNVILPNMKSYYNGDYPCDFDVSPVIKCPLHDENTPSFRYYSETESFFCWGCRAGGDVINLHREFCFKNFGEKPTFDASVRFLYNFFILGKETEELKRTKVLKSDDYLNSVQEQAIFEGYVRRLEQTMIADGSLSLESKKAIWNHIDIVKKLVEKNRVKVDEAKQSIQSVVRMYI